MIPKPTPAFAVVMEPSNRPKTSNWAKCFPKPVCRKCCIASFHATAHGKNGGNKFCAGRQNIFPAIPQSGESNSCCRPHAKVCWPTGNPVHAPACFQFRQAIVAAEISTLNATTTQDSSGFFHNNFFAGYAATSHGSSSGKLVCFTPVSNPAASSESHRSPIFPVSLARNANATAASA